MLSEEFRRGLEERVTRLEGASSVELCVAVRKWSGNYRDLDHVVAAFACLVLLTGLVYAPHEFPQELLMVALTLTYVVTLLVISRWPGIYRRLASRGRREAQVLAGARDAFVSERVASTRDRSGILLYISWHERRALVLADLGVEAHLGRGPLNAAEARWNRESRGFEAALLAELDALMAPLSAALPRKEDDSNELADEIRVLA